MSQSASESSDPVPARTDTDVVIVGGGPIGIELAVGLRRAGVRFEVIEAGPIGHTMSWWAPQTRWFSSNERIAIAGVPLETPDQGKATREQYLTYLRGVVRQFRIPIRCFERVTGVDRQESRFVVTTDARGERRRLVCDRVVLAIGGTDHPKPMGIDGEDLQHVDGFLRDPHQYFGRRVLIVGGRNSAIEAALRLHHVGAEVSISYRRSGLPSESIKYWLRPEIEGLIGSGSITAYFSTEPVRIEPGRVWLRRLLPAEANSDDPLVADDGSDELIEVVTDDVLRLIGYEQDKTLFRRCGIELVGPMLAPRFDAETMETNVPGIYVAGTAVAGTQTSHFKTFLENCHVHVSRIVSQIAWDDVRSPDRVSRSPSPETALKRQISAMPES